MRFRRIDPWLAAGLALCGLLLLVALYGDRIAPHDASYVLPQGPNGEERPFPPGVVFPLGSDNAGRDLLSVVILGARTSLAIVLAAGLARLGLGLALAFAGARVRAFGGPLDLLAELVGSLPATVAALLLIAAFFAQNTPLVAPIVALAIVGWAGPYRLARAELGRLEHAAFTEGARVLGATRMRILLRHHLPHLVPTLALSAAQQVAASLVAVAELGVLGAFVGAIRSVDVVESLKIVRATDATMATIQDVPEWGGMLALSRGLVNVYFSRWVILVPAVAIAFAAVSVSLLGIGVARQYARRDLLRDLTPRRTVVVVLLGALVAAPAIVLPPRDADALALASRARAALPLDDLTPEDLAAEASAMGLRAVGEGFEVGRTASFIEQTGAARVSVSLAGRSSELAQGWGADADFMPVLYERSGGGVVDAPVVFLGLGIAPPDYPKLPHNPFIAPPFSDFAERLPDDYAAVDVRGKVVLFVRVERYFVGREFVVAPDVSAQIDSALRRGAVAVLVADNRKSTFAVSQGGARVSNPYLTLEADGPIRDPRGPPVLVVDPRVAEELLQGSGVSATSIFTARASVGGFSIPGIAMDDPFFQRSLARDLEARLRIELPVDHVTRTSRSIIAETGAPVGDGVMVVWATAPSRVDRSASASRVLHAIVEATRGIDAPLVFVLFDPSGDANANAALVAERLRGIPVHVIVALDTLRGSKLRFLTRYGVLQPPIDHYADRVGAPHLQSGGNNEPAWPTGVLNAFPDTHYVFISGEVGDGEPDAAVSAAAAVVGYAVARFAARGPELLR